MKYCTNCGKPIKMGDKFCNNCGSPVGEKNSKRETVFEGDIHKCPNCGEVINSFQSRCPSCGFEFRNSKSSDAVKSFSEKLEELEAKRKPETTIGSLAKAFGVSSKADAVDEQILSLIRNYNVPNTKEDVFEFMILASSNINYSALSANSSSDAGANSSEELNAMKTRSEAWISKLEQVYQKAKISFGDDPDFQKVTELYDKTKGQLDVAQKKKKLNNMKWWLGMLGAMLVIVLLFSIIAIPHHLKEKKLERTVIEIQEDIANGDYEAAWIKANSLQMDDGWSSDSEEHWDQQREYLLEMIEKKMNE